MSKGNCGLLGGQAVPTWYPIENSLGDDGYFLAGSSFSNNRRASRSTNKGISIGPIKKKGVRIIVNRTFKLALTRPCILLTKQNWFFSTMYWATNAKIKNAIVYGINLLTCQPKNDPNRQRASGTTKTNVTFRNNIISIIWPILKFFSNSDFKLKFQLKRLFRKLTDLHLKLNRPGYFRLPVGRNRSVGGV